MKDKERIKNKDRKIWVIMFVFVWYKNSQIKLALRMRTDWLERNKNIKIM